MPGIDRRLPMVRSFLLLVLATSVSLGEPGRRSRAADERVVIPFDFQSDFDQGRYGQMIGDMVWKKLSDSGGFVIPETMLDVRDWCQRHKMVARSDTSLEEMRRVVCDEFGGQIGIWGRVERVPGQQWDVYDLWIKIVDFSPPAPSVIYDNKARTKTVSEIPHVYVKEALDKLYGRGPAGPVAADPEIARRWETQPNLIRGDFEPGSGQPAGWDPLPPHVTWLADSQTGGRLIRFTIPEDVAATTGVLYYSDYFPVTAGGLYRIQARWRTTGSAVKIFVKCYDEMPSSYRKEGTQNPTQRREVYRSQQNLQGPKMTWNVHTEDFTPKHTQFTPRWGRVMLYGYWPKGVVDWDDIVVKEVTPSAVANARGPRRPSLETKVTTEEWQRAQQQKPP